ncbi:hypothetical protein PUN28_015642 [Cardiocondyla obscurior]|uniref:Uncharacterized protein n=1 Tax=Cardiocondyla obscurior TaxID=286306 RepID=A0AAW2EV84_9HYME
MKRGVRYSRKGLKVKIYVRTWSYAALLKVPLVGPGDDGKTSYAPTLTKSEQTRCRNVIWPLMLFDGYLAWSYVQFSQQHIAVSHAVPDCCIHLSVASRRSSDNGVVELPLYSRDYANANDARILCFFIISVTSFPFLFYVDCVFDFRDFSDITSEEEENRQEDEAARMSAPQPDTGGHRDFIRRHERDFMPTTELALSDNRNNYFIKARQS